MKDRLKNSGKKIPKSKWLPILLLLYLIGMAIYFGIDKLKNGETIEFFAIILIDLLVIALLYILLKKIEQRKE